MLAGSISNSKLINSSILIGSSSVSLGATASSLTGLDSVSANSITVAGQPTTYGVVNPAYIVVGLVNSVTLFGASQTFVLDTVLSNTNSQVSYNTSSGVFTLTAGVTYDMSFTPSFINFSNTLGGYLCYEWVDATTNTTLDSTGTGLGTALPSTESGGQVDNLTARVIYTPSTNQTVKLRVTSANGTATLRGAIGTQVIIKPMNLSVAVQATATGTTSTNFIKYTRSAQQTGLSNGSVVVCNVLENSSGNLVSANTSTGQITLTAGKTYRLTGMIPVFSTSGNDARPQFCWYNETSAAYIGNSTALYVPSSNAGFGTSGGPAQAVITANSTTVVSFRLLSGATNLAGIGNSGDFTATGSYPWIDIEEIGSTFALNALDTMTTTGNVTVGGNLSVTGNTGNVVTKNSGSWTLSTGANTVSFTVPIGNTYTMWVNGNIPNGICVWNATATVTNTNVPVIGQQFAWYYSGGNALVITSIPAQIIGTAGTISTASPAVGTTTNVFTFGITNNSGTGQTVNYGWNKIS
jgi:hypothetical protein